MNRQQLIDSIVAYMETKLDANAIEFIRLPESNKSVNFPVAKGRMTIAHDDEEINYIKDVAAVSHDVKIGLAIELRSKWLYDEKGIYAMMGLLDTHLLGVKFGQFKPLTYKTGLKFVAFDDDYWVYMVTMITETKVVQSQGSGEEILFTGTPTIELT